MSYYLTTPIYYVNDQPHIGHAYTTIVGDVLCRYHRLFGEPTKFLTGVDEHGQKIQTAADARKMDPKSHCDEMAQHFVSIWKELNIQYDVFFRTTDEYHKKSVQKAMQQLFDQGDVYSQEYQGWYSVSEEVFYPEKDLVNGKAPTGRDVTWIKENNYFFRMSKYQERLIDHINANPDFIQPVSKRNEVLGFLRQPLQDLSISRPKARLRWGIDLPFDNEHVTYVWFDALLNYTNGVGFLQPERSGEFEKWWTKGKVVHLLGKDILTTHSVYWTTMLMALGVKLPDTIFAHGWWLTDGNQKMSKSEGTVVKPLDVKDRVGVDSLRYFLIRDISFGNDAQFSVDLVLSRVNSDLANNLGNLLSRSTNLIQKFFDGKFPEHSENLQSTKDLKKKALELADKVESEIRGLAPHRATEAIFDLLSDANKNLEDIAPWKALKDPTLAETGKESLTTTIELLRIAAILLYPVMPTKMESLLRQIGWTGKIEFNDAKKWGLISTGTQIAKAEPLFPRVESQPIK